MRQLPELKYKGMHSPYGYKKGFNEKSEKIQILIRESLYIINELGIPTDDLTDKKKEKVALALLAVGDIKSSKDWVKIKDSNKNYAVTTKQMIEFYNEYLEENMSKGSYDYVLRDGLNRLLIAGIVKNSKPEANISDSTRGYTITVEYSRIIKNFNQSDWEEQVKIFKKSHKTYSERIEQKRNIPKITVRTTTKTIAKTTVRTITGITAITAITITSSTIVKPLFCFFLNILPFLLFCIYIFSKYILLLYIIFSHYCN